MNGEQLVQVGNDVIAFPAGMSDAQIAAAIKSQSEVPDRSLFQSGGMAVKNAVPSTIKGLAGIVGAALTPVQTAQGLGDVLTGNLKKVLPQQAVSAINEFNPEGAKRAEMAANAFNQDLGESYGSWPRIKNTLATDPFKFAADLSMVGGGAGVAAKAAKATKLGETLSRVGELNPVGAVTKPLAKGSEFFGKSAEELNKLKAQNATMDATIKQSLDAGYTIPRSLYNPSALSNTLESVGGKAATLQDAAKRNQARTNDLAKQYLGLPEDVAFSKQLINDLKISKSAPYKQAEQLPSGVVGQSTTKSMGTGKSTTKDIVKDGKSLVSEINEAREAAQGYWADARTGSNRNESKRLAKAKQDEVSNLESQLETLAKINNMPDLVQNLRQSRVELAKIYSIDRALNTSTGDVIAADLRNQWIKDAPFTKEAKAIAEFGDAFPTISREGSKVPNPEVSQTKAIVSYLAGGGGAGTGAVLGGPPGAAIGALLGIAGPLTIPPAAKALALSKALQKQKTYKPGALQSLSKANKAALGLYQMNQAQQGEQ
jgi:hypothetical protein